MGEVRRLFDKPVDHLVEAALAEKDPVILDGPVPDAAALIEQARDRLLARGVNLKEGVGRHPASAIGGQVLDGEVVICSYAVLFGADQSGIGDKTQASDQLEAPSLRLLPGIEE